MALDDSIPDDRPDICRKFFPYLRDPGSDGVSPVGRGKAAASFCEDAKTMECYGRERWQALAPEVRDSLLMMLPVPATEIEFFAGTTPALNVIGHSLGWGPGDEVVFAEDEFPSVRLAWQGAERAGAVLCTVAILSEAERQATLEAANTGRTKLVIATQVHSQTGTLLDLDALGRADLAGGALFIVDGIHALGAPPVHLDHVDFLAAGVFKWMLAGFGLAVCVICDSARASLRPAFRGYLNEGPEGGMQYAHVNYPGLYALKITMTLLGEDFGWGMVQARTRALVGGLAEELARDGIELGAPPGALASLASFPVGDPEAMKDRLAAGKIFVAPKVHRLQATPYFYNSREDIHRLATAPRSFN